MQEQVNEFREALVRTRSRMKNARSRGSWSLARAAALPFWAKASGNAAAVFRTPRQYANCLRAKRQVTRSRQPIARYKKRRPRRVRASAIRDGKLDLAVLNSDNTVSVALGNETLPTRVETVCSVALPHKSIAVKVGPRRHTRSNWLELFSRTSLCPCASKEIVMNSRAFFLVTSLAVLWFRVFTTGTELLQNARPIGDPQNPQVDIPSLQEQARRGDARAEYLLGWSYMNGTGVPKNYVEAAKYYRQAAAQASPDAEFSLGYLYEQGKSVLRDYQQAVVYYTAASRHGHLTAENNLGSMYEFGRGVHKNIRQAERWYRMAAERGDVTAQCNLASLYFRGTGIARNYSQAANWFREASELGYAPAQENLAWMYFSGTGVPQDYSKAAQWVQTAADKGYAHAQLDLGYLYEQGKGVPLDYGKASMWYKAAASGGEGRAVGRLNSLSSVMTKEQISKASAAAGQLSKSLPRVDAEADSQSIRSSFIRPR
jgi:TPR repeat protein